MADTTTAHSAPPPAPGYLASLRFDALAGFLVFLIALPLCLGIAKASNFPPIAGIWTAVIGGLICTFISNSEMTIKGPAAGLIVIVSGAVTSFGAEALPNLSEDRVAEVRAEGKSANKSDEEIDNSLKKELASEQIKVGYPFALGIGVVAGVIQILFGLFKAGKLGDFFPLPAVHGMLASIGLIIIAKQAYLVFGVDPPAGANPLQLLAAIPGSLPKYNPDIAAIGVISLAILFGLPLIRNKYAKMIPAQMVVLLVTIPLGYFAFDLTHPHHYTFASNPFDTGHPSGFDIGKNVLVDIKDVFSGDAIRAFGQGKFLEGARQVWGNAFSFPDFSRVMTPTGLKYIVLFALIGSLESLLSAKAIDLLDPYRRKTDLNRDTGGVGVSNTIAAFIGSLPMISEIVRSSANINNGARTRMANFFHGCCLLIFVLSVPSLIHTIPNAALGAMLVYTGFRLASPQEFWKTYKIGIPQFIVFVGTIIATLMTDLLIGIFSGIALKAICHVVQGVPVKRLFWPSIEVQAPPPQLPDSPAVVVVRDAAVFSTWLMVQGAIQKAAKASDRVVLDLSQTVLVDHSVMEKLHELEREFSHMGKHLEVRGLEDHKPLSDHPHAARRRTKNTTAA